MGKKMGKIAQKMKVVGMSINIFALQTYTTHKREVGRRQALF